MTLTLDIDAVAEALGAEPTAEAREGYRPRYNLPPTDPHVVAISDGGKRRLVRQRWGLGLETLKKPQINARAETVHKLGIFKRSFEERRCLVPADGFYEWTGPKSRRRPIWFHPRAGGILVFAGIYDARGFCVITTSANGEMAPIHDRMPVILSPEGAERWLRVADVGLLVPAEEGKLLGTPVSSRVGSVANDDPACLEPAGAEPGQLDLL